MRTGIALKPPTLGSGKQREIVFDNRACPYPVMLRGAGE
jgi:hypothetical protein